MFLEGSLRFKFSCAFKCVSIPALMALLDNKTGLSFT